MLNKEQLKPFQLTSVMKHGCPLSPLLFNRALEFTATAVRKEHEIIWIPIGKEEFKLFLFANDMILYIKDPTYSTKKLLQSQTLLVK
jgi:hypothetical protein